MLQLFTITLTRAVVVVK